MRNVRLRSPFDGAFRLPHCILDLRYIEGRTMDYLNQIMSHFCLEKSWKKWNKVDNRIRNIEVC